MQLLTDSYQRHPQQGELLLSAEHIKALGMLMSASASKDLEVVFLQALQSEPVLALAVGVVVQAHRLSQCSHTSLAIVAMQAVVSEQCHWEVPQETHEELPSTH